MAIVVPALLALSRELTQVAPNRVLPDWFIGDLAHQVAPSGHNPDETGWPEDWDADDVDEIRAGDYRAALRHPTLTMEQVVQYLVRECRAGRITWIKYLIFRRRIWTASGTWATQVYTGSNPHDDHLHASSKPDTASENSTRPVGLASLVEDDVSQADVIAALRSTEGQQLLAKAVLGRAWSASGRTLAGSVESLLDRTTGDAVGRAVWDYREPDPELPEGHPDYGKRTLRMGGAVRTMNARRNAQTADLKAAVAAAVTGNPGDIAAVLDRIDQHAAAEAQRDQELRELVRQVQTGERDAAEVVRLIGERLAGAGRTEPAQG